MAQLNFYVPAAVEKGIRQQAKARGKSISSYLAEVMKKQIRQDRWQKDFFRKVVAGWQGDFPKIERSLPEARDVW